MNPVYEIKFLGSKDFDNLPVTETNGSDISDSLGFYNPYTNRIFIRHTAIPELDKYLLEHEFDHILEDKATDADENGIRHKKKRGFVDWITGLSTAGLFTPNSDSVAEQNKANDAQQAQEQQMAQMFPSFGNLGMSQNMTSGSSYNPIAGQESTQNSLNQGLNQQSINPLSNDPYARYGQQSGRIYNF